MFDSIFWVCQDKGEAFGEGWEQVGESGWVEQANRVKIAQMHAVLVPPGRKFHPDESGQGDEPEVPGVFGLARPAPPPIGANPSRVPELWQ